jgi:hypothetical protein
VALVAVKDIRSFLAVPPSCLSFAPSPWLVPLWLVPLAGCLHKLLPEPFQLSGSRARILGLASPRFHSVPCY